MKIKKNNIVFILVFLYGLNPVLAQKGFNFKRKITGVKNEWQQLYLPIDMYNNCKPDFSDIRIQAYTNKGDTLIVPYILEKVNSIQKEERVDFKIINESYRNDWYYFTLVCPTDVLVNNLELNFEEENFDWHVNLDAAEQLGEWITILDDVRILAFKNEESSYVFSKLKFSDSKFPYYRVSIHGTTKPKLKSVFLSHSENIPGSAFSYKVNNFKAINDLTKKETIIDFELDEVLPVQSIQLFIKTQTDFFRNTLLEYSSDSVFVDSKWNYIYTPLIHSYISSDDYAPIKFGELRAKKFRLRIFNDDNEPIKLESVQVFGPKHKLIVRLNNLAANYYLFYGNKMVQAPVYDLINFKNKIPTELENLNLGPEMKGDIVHEEADVPIVQKKSWLWLVLIAMVLLLSYFSIKMLKQEKR
jgi:hypothetical protein